MQLEINSFKRKTCIVYQSPTPLRKESKKENEKPHHFLQLLQMEGSCSLKDAGGAFFTSSLQSRVIKKNHNKRCLNWYYGIHNGYKTKCLDRFCRPLMEFDPKSIVCNKNARTCQTLSEKYYGKLVY